MAKKRILWLFNHTSLRKFEVPLLIEMGYEVYCPKKWTLDFGDYSASISYEYDKSLSIPEEDIDFLNHIDFYHEFNTAVMKKVNKYFDIIFAIFDPSLVDAIATNFKGIFVLHVFGLLREVSHTSILYNENHCNTLEKLKAMKSRFWFSVTYNNLSDVECELLKKRTLYMPIGIPEIKNKKEWIGKDTRILFVLSKIYSNQHYYAVYQDFKKNFNDIPHVIGGAQPLILENDKSIAGFLPQEQYEYNMKHLAAMFYHSQEPRHLHYHPLEAINNGMPLVFMAGGMLDHVGGKNLPGRCETIAEARSKLKKLSRGDKQLQRKILQSQNILLKQFTKKYCIPYWEEAMRRISTSVESNNINVAKTRKIAIIMPGCWKGGILDYSKRFALALQQEIDKHHDNIKLVFAYPEDSDFQQNTFNELKQAGIDIRNYFVTVEGHDWIDRALKLSGFKGAQDIAYASDKYSILHDGMSDFQDCDYIFVMNDNLFTLYPMIFFKPFSIVVHDYIQRYVPSAISMEAKKNKIMNQRFADKILVTSKATYDDAISYCGINKQKIILTPLLCDFSLPQLKKENFSYAIKKKKYKDYFIWSTNTTPHKNHEKALEALEEYYSQGGEIECFITGVNTQYFIPKSKLKHAPVSKEYVKMIQDKISNSTLLKNHLHILGNLPKKEYKELLAHASFVFHPGYGDNGNFTVADAANEGVPAVCSDYPAARDLANFVGIKPLFANPFNATDLADALMVMEKQRDKFVAEIPSHEKLVMASYENKAEELYKVVKNIIGF